MACEDADTATDAIKAALAGPKQVTADGMTVEQFGLLEMIEAQKHLASKCAATSPRRGLRFTRLIAPGTTE